MTMYYQIQLDFAASFYFQGVSSRSVTLLIGKPDKMNGILVEYKFFVNSTVVSIIYLIFYLTLFYQFFGALLG